MKTVFEWLNELPEMKKLKSVYNCVSQGKSSSLDEFVDSLSEALHIAFQWTDTEEGYEYWAKTADKYITA